MMDHELTYCIDELTQLTRDISKFHVLIAKTYNKRVSRNLAMVYVGKLDGEHRRKINLWWRQGFSFS